jgi:MFS family permease
MIHHKNYARTALIVASLSHIITDATFAFFPAIMPSMVAHLSLTYADVGLFFTAIITVIVFLQPVAGLFSDKFDELVLLVLGIFIIFLSFVLLSFMKSFIEFVLFGLIYAAGYSIYHPISLALLSRICCSRVEQTKNMGKVGMIGDIGTFTAFITTGFVAKYFGWKIPLFLWGGLAFSVGCINLTISRHQISLHTRAQIFSNSNFIRETHRKKLPNVRRFMIVISSVCFFLGGISGAFMNFTTLFLTDAMNLTYELSGVLFSVCILSCIMGTLSSGYADEYFGIKRTLIFALSVQSICMLLLYLQPIRSFLGICILLITSSFFIAITFPVVYSLVGFTTSQIRGLFYGFSMSLIFGGDAIISYLVGQLTYVAGNISIIYLIEFILATCSVIAISCLPFKEISKERNS